MVDVEKYIMEAVEHISCAVVEKQEQLIWQTVQQIGGDRYHTITIDKGKVLNAFKKYTPATPVHDKHDMHCFHCPSCGIAVKKYRNSPKMPYCGWCGQALDWS